MKKICELWTHLKTILQVYYLQCLPYSATLMNIQWIFQSWFGPLVIHSTAHFSVIFRIILHVHSISHHSTLGFRVYNELWISKPSEGDIKKEHHSIGHKLLADNGALIKIWHMNFKVSTPLWMRILLHTGLKFYYITTFPFEYPTVKFMNLSSFNFVQGFRHEK